MKPLEALSFGGGRRVLRAVLALAAGATVLLRPSFAAAQACCGGTPQGGLPVLTRLPGAPGTLTASLDWELRQLDTPARTSGPALAPLLDQRLTMQLYTLAAEVSATSWLAAAVIMPFAVNNESVTLPDGTNLHASAVGPGDAALVGKVRILAPTAGSDFVPTVVLVGGGRAPTGPSTLQSDQLGIFSPPLQPGTGAWGALFGVSAVQPLTRPLSVRPWSLYGNVVGSYTASNPRGYEFGPALSYGVGVQVLLWHQLALQGGVAGVAVAADQIHGTTAPDTGSHQVWLAPTIAWTIVPHVGVYAGARLPVWRSLNGTQLVGEYSLVAGAFANFSLWEG